MTSITASNTEDLTYLSGLYTGLYFYSNAADPASTDTSTTGTDGTKNLLYTLTSLTQTVSGNRLTIAWELPISQEWPSDTVTGSPTTTSIPLVSASGFSIRDLIEVQISGNYQRVTVTNISTNTLTVSPALSAAPASGVVVRVLCNQVAIRKSTTAGISDIFKDTFFKENGVSATGYLTIDLVR